MTYQPWKLGHFPERKAYLYYTFGFKEEFCFNTKMHIYCRNLVAAWQIIDCTLCIYLCFVLLTRTRIFHDSSEARSTAVWGIMIQGGSCWHACAWGMPHPQSRGMLRRPWRCQTHRWGGWSGPSVKSDRRDKTWPRWQLTWFRFDFTNHCEPTGGASRRPEWTVSLKIFIVLNLSLVFCPIFFLHWFVERNDLRLFVGCFL